MSKKILSAESCQGHIKRGGTAHMHGARPAGYQISSPILQKINREERVHGEAVRTIGWFSSSCENGAKYSNAKASICDVAWFFSSSKLPSDIQRCQGSKYHVDKLLRCPFPLVRVIQL